jgi:hypothetical protein
MQDWQLIELIYNTVAECYHVERLAIIERQKEAVDARRAVTKLMIKHLGYEAICDLFYILKEQVHKYEATKLSSLHFDLRFNKAQEIIYHHVFKSGHKYIA